MLPFYQMLFNKYEQNLNVFTECS